LAGSEIELLSARASKQLAVAPQLRIRNETPAKNPTLRLSVRERRIAVAS